MCCRHAKCLATRRKAKCRRCGLTGNPACLTVSVRQFAIESLFEVDAANSARRGVSIVYY